MATREVDDLQTDVPVPLVFLMFYVLPLKSMRDDGSIVGERHQCVYYLFRNGIVAVFLGQLHHSRHPQGMDLFRDTTSSVVRYSHTYRGYCDRVCLPVCLSVCLSVCLPVCLNSCGLIPSFMFYLSTIHG